MVTLSSVLECIINDMRDLPNVRHIHLTLLEMDKCSETMSEYGVCLSDIPVSHSCERQTGQGLLQDHHTADGPADIA